MAGKIGRKLYRTAAWQRTRRKVLDRDGWRCTNCGRAGALEVHHETAMADGGAELDMANLRSLCARCHWGEHSKNAIIGQAEWAEFLNARV